ncbi:MAG TPA: NAD-dependent epimerase/dehydratase family protein [Bryobacteraceae bacterium]|nr:NAD-dependent epimerase/dehydratase family protein [Bryobacteraceae bacterium]
MQEKAQDKAKDKMILVAGAGGFIGGAMVGELRRQGYRNIRAVDVKPLDEWYQVFNDADNLILDLNLKESCERATEGAAEVYNFAANMGGMGFIENNKALCMLSVLINTHMLQAAHKFAVERFFYSSSACVYNGDKQTDPNNPGLKEEDAYPALAEDGYGWEKLFSERMCRHFHEDYGMYVRQARFHNVYGPNGTWDGGREKAPAAICRKVIQAQVSGKHEIEIWGDGTRTRSFMYIDDCILGVQKIMNSEILEPINLGSSEMVSINQLVDIVEDIAGIKLKRTYDLDAPKGVMGRNSDNTLIKKYLNWEPGIPLRQGLGKTYAWIYDQYMIREKMTQSAAR